MAADPKLFDLTWVFPMPPDLSPRPVALNGMNTIAMVDPGVPAVVLFPSLMTPAIVVGKGDGAWVDVVLAFHKADLDRRIEGLDQTVAIKAIINRQLDAHPGLNKAPDDGARSYTHYPLVEGLDWQEKIEVLPLGELGSQLLDPAASGGQKFKDFSFLGRLHPEAVTLYGDKGFKTVYAVRFRASGLRAIKTPHEQVPIPRPGDAKGEKRIEKVKDRDPDLILNYHEKHVVKKPAMPGEGRFGWKVQGGDIEAGQVDWSNPIVQHHPVFHYEQLGCANLGHMSDIHVNSRQQILRTSPAKVIPVPEGDIPAIGEMLNIASANAKALFDHFSQPGVVDIVLVGGDLVDFICNAITGDSNTVGRASAAAVWDLVRMEENVGDCIAKAKYRDWVDFIGFYSLVVDFYRHGPAPKPLYVVSGNHDCYYEPYGISPRVVDKAGEIKNPTVGVGPVSGKLPIELRLRAAVRGNEGIPWDHNLTIYEAILAFGKSYGRVLTAGNPSPRPKSSFWKEKLSWFYTVLTPFSDYAIKLPQQVLVALGWGESEKLLDWSRPGGQGWGFLPRANEALADPQLTLLRDKAVKGADGRKVVLMTHFTFVSYANSLHNTMAADKEWGKWKTGWNKWGLGNDEGDVYYERGKTGFRDYALSDLGTFELHRPELYRDLIATDRALQVILTGHSHRRGFYTVRRNDAPTVGSNSVKTGFHDFPQFTAAGVPDTFLDADGNAQPMPSDDKQGPWIILSNSGGSVPRINQRGEFGGWGSSEPSGTAVTYGKGTTSIVEVSNVPVGCMKRQPRFVVALDYYDIITKSTTTVMGVGGSVGLADSTSGVIEEFRASFVMARKKVTHEFTFTLRFSDDLRQKGMYGTEQGPAIAKIALYFYYEPASRFVGVPLSPAGLSGDKTGTQWKIAGPFDSQLSNAEVFVDHAVGSRHPTFAAIQFAPSDLAHLQGYDFDTPWTFPVVIKEDSAWLQNPLADRKAYFDVRREAERKEIPDFDRLLKYAPYGKPFSPAPKPASPP